MSSPWWSCRAGPRTPSFHAPRLNQSPPRHLVRPLPCSCRVSSSAHAQRLCDPIPARSSSCADLDKPPRRPVCSRPAATHIGLRLPQERRHTRQGSALGPSFVLGSVADFACACSAWPWWPRTGLASKVESGRVTNIAASTQSWSCHAEVRRCLHSCIHSSAHSFIQFLPVSRLLRTVLGLLVLTVLLVIVFVVTLRNCCPTTNDFRHFQ